MKKFNEKIASLREISEMAIKGPNDNETFTEDSILKLLHELEVHQIELETQNEELISAKEKAEVLTQKYTALYNFAPMGYYTLNRKGLILEVNHNGAILLGKQKDELIGNNLKNFIFPETQSYFKEFLTRVFESNSKINCELRLNAPETQEVYIYIEGIVSSADECLIAAIDISERHRNEKILTENEARLQELNATKDKFFSIIAHDLKGPFTSIIGFSEILLEQIQNKNYENLEKFTNIVHNSSVQTLYLLSNLLEWSRLQTGKLSFNPEYVEVNSAIENVIKFLNSSIQQKSIAVSNNLNRDYKVFADPDMLSSVFRNIISNAIKFTPDGGTIKIEAEEQNDALLFTITDTGVGIPSGDIKKLFRIDTLYSTKGTQKEAGTGLGLLLCQEFIDKHGGRIWVESEPGMGSKFFFTIPAKQTP